MNPYILLRCAYNRCSLPLLGRFAAEEAGLYSFTIYAVAKGDAGEFRIMRSDGTPLCVAWISGERKFYLSVGMLQKMHFSNSHFGHGLFNRLMVTFQGQTEYFFLISGSLGSILEQTSLTLNGHYK